MRMCFNEGETIKICDFEEERDLLKQKLADFLLGEYDYPQKEKTAKKQKTNANREVNKGACIERMLLLTYLPKTSEIYIEADMITILPLNVKLEISNKIMTFLLTAE